MKLSSIAMCGLSEALAASNVWWIHQSTTSGATVVYLGESIDAHQEALAEALAILPVAARVGATRVDVVSAALSVASNKEWFEETGYVWVGRLRLGFDAKERVSSIGTVRLSDER